MKDAILKELSNWLMASGKSMSEEQLELQAGLWASDLEREKIPMDALPEVFSRSRRASAMITMAAVVRSWHSYKEEYWAEKNRNSAKRFQGAVVDPHKPTWETMKFITEQWLWCCIMSRIGSLVSYLSMLSSTDRELWEQLVDYLESHPVPAQIDEREHKMVAWRARPKDGYPVATSLLRAWEDATGRDLKAQAETYGERRFYAA